ncbi:MAG: hypothetical protein JW941_13025 [Candidatus Coatesbacteria bacterium]|nr:hypothetical protein [Candidatus Coatesbacteria bacterium]
MKVEIEGRRLDVSRNTLVQMAHRKAIQPWHYIKSQELTGNKWTRARELTLFYGIWTEAAPFARTEQTSKAARPKPAPRYTRASTRTLSAKRHVHHERQAAKEAEDTIGKAYFELHGFRVFYKVSCPKCKNALTKLGVEDCPRCGAKLAAGKALFYVKRALYGISMLAIFGGAFLTEKLGDWAKFLYPVSGVLISLTTVIARGAKVLISISIKGRALPAKEVLIPLSDYYSSNAWKKTAERVKSVFRLSAVLRKMKSEQNAAPNKVKEGLFG